MASDRDYISGSDLARMGYCERQVAFDAAVGRRSTAEQRAAQGRGLAAHAAFYRESQRLVSASQTRGRCFVATLALGDCAETRALRAFRDVCLRRTRTGRRLITLYYIHSPALCRWLEARPAALAASRLPLSAAARLAGWIVQVMTGGRHVR